MKDAEGKVLYVGKANCLPDRISSYFIESADLGLKKQPMLEAVEDVEVIPCEGEWEALLMEARLVKDLKPRFNTLLLDDKTFPYLAVTTRDEFPGVYITRDPSAPRFRGAKLYGPFTSGGSLRHAVHFLQRVFQYRTCELDIRADDPRNRSFRPCLLHSMAQCTAPCANRVSRERYREDINRFCRFLEGKRSVMLRELRQEMLKASQENRYEEAAILRDQVQSIERLDERERRGDEPEYDWQPEVTISVQDPKTGCKSLQRALGLSQEIQCVEAIDIAHLGGGETVGSLVCFVNGRPFKERYRRFRIQTVANDDYAAIREVVSRRYREEGRGSELYPDVILIDGGAGQLGAALDAFGEFESKPPFVVSLAKKEELIYVQRESEPMKLGRDNPGLKLCQAIRDEAHRYAQHYHHLLVRKRLMPEGAAPRKKSKPSTRRKPGG
ncbi:MAG: UvrB/UvrC motif-containing protein [Planctomycetes bacterium]|nr:UvrB/UvrC motif-containing protein [Planctomycetota bacterium]